MFLVSTLMFSLVAGLLGYSEFGEPCNHTDECSDHRLRCNGDGIQLGVCVCGRFYKWMGENASCVQMYNTSTIMDITIREHTSLDLSQIIDDYNDKVFVIQIIAGCFVMVVCTLSVVVVMIYCCYVRRSDQKLKREIKQQLQPRQSMSCRIV